MHFRNRRCRYPVRGRFTRKTDKILYQLHATAIGHSSADTSARSGVKVVHRPWPLAKGNGFILVLMCLSGVISAPSKVVKYSRTRGRNLIYRWAAGIVGVSCASNDSVLVPAAVCEARYFQQPLSGIARACLVCLCLCRRLSGLVCIQPP